MLPPEVATISADIVNVAPVSRVSADCSLLITVSQFKHSILQLVLYITRGIRPRQQDGKRSSGTALRWQPTRKSDSTQDAE
jgi:hypothetical protein